VYFKEAGQITKSGQSSLNTKDIPIAYIVFPTPISSPKRNLPALKTPNVIPST